MNFDFTPVHNAAGALREMQECLAAQAEGEYCDSLISPEFSRGLDMEDQDRELQKIARAWGFADVECAVNTLALAVGWRIVLRRYFGVLPYTDRGQTAAYEAQYREYVHTNILPWSTRPVDTSVQFSVP